MICSCQPLGLTLLLLDSFSRDVPFSFLWRIVPMQPHQQQIDALQAKGDHAKLASHAAIVWECVVCPQPPFKLNNTMLNLPAKGNNAKLASAEPCFQTPYECFHNCFH